MSLGGYETSFIVSGLALAGAGLLPQAKVKERLTFAAIGAGTTARPVSQRPAPVTLEPCPHCGSAVEPGFAKCGNCRQLVRQPGV